MDVVAPKELDAVWRCVGVVLQVFIEVKVALTTANADNERDIDVGVVAVMCPVVVAVTVK